MRNPHQSPGRMKNSSYYIAPVGDRTHELPHTVATNMVKVSHGLNHSATAAVKGVDGYLGEYRMSNMIRFPLKVLFGKCSSMTVTILY